jgi:hypothetical protein
MLDRERRSREARHLEAVNQALRSETAALLKTSAELVARSSLLVAAACAIIRRWEPQGAVPGPHRTFDTANADLVAEILAARIDLHEIRARFTREHDRVGLLNGILEVVTKATRTDLGNIQLVNRRTGGLEIVAQRGFGPEFLDFFGEVHDERAACGAAMRAQKRIVVEDVVTHPIFRGQPAQAVLLRAGVRAVQSTPLVTRSGELVGMMSTHFRSAYRVPVQRLLLIDVIGRQTAELVGEVHAT